MPKKKQVTFQSNIPGKFIPRDDASSTSVFRNGTSANRFNSKMVELLASSPEPSVSSIITQESESTSNSTKSTPDDSGISVSPETTSIDSSRMQSKLLHRRIATMLDTLRRRSGNTGITSPPVSPRLIPTHIDSKSQPITFGQLRQANSNTPSPPPPPPPPIPPRSPMVQNVRNSKIVTAHSYTDLLSMNPAERQSYQSNLSSDLGPPIATNSERVLYSSSVEQLREQHHVTLRNTEQIEPIQQDEQQQQQQQQQTKAPLTVEDILAGYYSKIKVSSMIEPQPSTTTTFTNNNNPSFYIHPPSSSSGWNNSPLLLNNQNRTRPPPPSYSVSVANGHRPQSQPHLPQHLIRPPVPTSVHEPTTYPSNQIPSHLLPTNTYLSPSIRPPPPRYESSASHIERSNSDLSSANPPQAGFDREFSRLLYGKEGRRTRHQRQKRKAFSDPVKKSVEEAGRSVEKSHRRLTTHLNRTDTVKEEEENTSDSTEIERHERDPFLVRQFQRRSELIENTRESAKKAIVPANPLLKRRIPSFLRVYSQASSSNDILLQWHLFSSSDLESFDGMMKKLYKDENLIRVQMYENYRALLLSTLSSKTTRKTDDDDNGITTTAL